MTVHRRESRRPSESEADFARRETENEARIKAAEESLRKTRERVKERFGRE